MFSAKNGKMYHKYWKMVPLAKLIVHEFEYICVNIISYFLDDSNVVLHTIFYSYLGVQHMKLDMH